MTEKQQIFIAYLASGLFLALSSGLILMEKFWLAAVIPVGLLLIYLYIYKLDVVLLMITFFTPVAVKLSDMEMGVAVSIPTEPLMLGVLILFFLKALFESGYDNRVLKHPVTVAIIFNLVWIFFTSVTSELPLVSFKFLLSRLWFVIPFYFLGILLFKRIDNIKYFLWLYILPLLYVIGHSTLVLASHGFDEDVSHWAMSPFYNDHTEYGAVLALLLPFTIAFTVYRKYPIYYRLFSFLISVVLMVGLYLSSSRAAWVSFIAAFMVLVIIQLKIKFRYVFLLAGILIGLFFSFRPQIVDKLEQNKQDSSGDFYKNVQSIYNISTDASNLERINRWQSALRMFEERPFVGWGPGTYQFVYAPFQRSKEKTIISTNFGNMGNAHSEYLGPLSESGVLGALTIILVVALVLNRALRIYKESTNAEVRLLALSSLLALTTYFTHGILNNFLSRDKLSVPVWGIMAIIVALDIYHKRKKDDNSDQQKYSDGSDESIKNNTR